MKQNGVSLLGLSRNGPQKTKETLACSRRSDSRAQRSVGVLESTARKRLGGGGVGERLPSPFPRLVSPRSFFLLEFFSLVLLSERLEQAKEIRGIYPGTEVKKI